MSLSYCTRILLEGKARVTATVYTWKSRVENEHCSVVCFKWETVLEAQCLCTSVKGGVRRCINIVTAFTWCAL